MATGTLPVKRKNVKKSAICHNIISLNTWLPQMKSAPQHIMQPSTVRTDTDCGQFLCQLWTVFHSTSQAYNLAPEFDFGIAHQFPDFVLNEIGEFGHVLLVRAKVEEVEDRA